MHPSCVIPRYTSCTEPMKSYNFTPPAVTFLCSLIYHLQAAHRWLYSFYPCLNTKSRAPCLHLSHSSMQGLVPTHEDKSLFYEQVCFHHRNLLPLLETSAAAKGQKTVLKQKRLVPDKNYPVEIFDCGAQTLLSVAKMVSHLACG